ncbi:MAG: prenyltransferase/squalene oxidase repeat-containing protein [Pirellulales bacterium]
MPPPLSYLEALMLRLARGMEGLGEPLRRRQAEYLMHCQQRDGGFAGREGPSDLYYTGFGLRGLALLGELDGTPAERAASFIKSRLAGQAPIVDFVSLLYAAALLETAAGIDVFEAAPQGWRQAVAATLEGFRRADGGYAKTAEGQSSSTYQTFLIVISKQLIGEPPVEPLRLIEFARSRQRDDGGFVEIGPMRASGTNPTAAAAALLRILGAIDEPARQAVVGFLAAMQTGEGGLKANTRIGIADLLSTFTGSLTLADADALAEIDGEAARDYVLGLELPSGGFRGGEWDSGTDVEYTFYGLAALALLG